MSEFKITLGVKGINERHCSLTVECPTRTSANIKARMECDYMSKLQKQNYYIYSIEEFFKDE